MNQYLSEFQIIGTSVKSFKIKNDFVALNHEQNEKRDIKLSHSITSIGKIDDEASYLGTILLNIKSKISANKKKYTIDLSIEGCFSAPIDMGEENFRDMLQINGLTSLYSIARAFIQSTTSQTVLSGSILLPMFNVAAYSKDLDSQNQEQPK